MPFKAIDPADRLLELDVIGSRPETAARIACGVVITLSQGRKSSFTRHKGGAHRVKRNGSLQV